MENGFWLTYKCCTREVVTELPENAFAVTCAGCHKIVYGLADEDCRQVRMPNSFKYKVIITLKKSILDNAGNAVVRALDQLGFPQATNVRIGKILEIELDQYDDELAEKMAKSQTNEVMEDFKVTRM